MPAVKVLSWEERMSRVDAIINLLAAYREQIASLKSAEIRQRQIRMRPTLFNTSITNAMAGHSELLNTTLVGMLQDLGNPNIEMWKTVLKPSYIDNSSNGAPVSFAVSSSAPTITCTHDAFGSNGGQFKAGDIVEISNSENVANDGIKVVSAVTSETVLTFTSNFAVTNTDDTTMTLTLVGRS